MYILRGLVFVLFISNVGETYADENNLKNKINYDQVHKIINAQLVLIHKEMDRILSMKDEDIKGRGTIDKLYDLIYPVWGGTIKEAIEEELCELEGSDKTIFGDNCMLQPFQFGAETTKLIISKIYKPDMPTKFTLEEIKNMKFIQSLESKELFALSDNKRNILIDFKFDQKREKYIIETISIRSVKDGDHH